MAANNQGSSGYARPNLSDFKPSDEAEPSAPPPIQVTPEPPAPAAPAPQPNLHQHEPAEVVAVMPGDPVPSGPVAGQRTVMLTPVAAARIAAANAAGRKYAQPIPLHELVSTGAELDPPHDPNEMIEYTVNLSPNSDRVVLDGMTYFQGGTYVLPRHMVASIMEVEQRGWIAEMETLGGRNANVYRQAYETILNGKTGGVKHGPTPLPSLPGAVVNQRGQFAR